ncbi:MAG: NADH-quinone oxidoreductase subunit L [Elusimicrobia bacterium]|nr:NADH-quinone oxidoreductase subunit L [Elusimicrobiota bacterium]
MLIEYSPLIFFLPLLAFPVILALGRWLPAKGASLGIAVMSACFALSAALFGGALSGSITLPYRQSVTWFNFGMYDVTMGVMVDGLTIVMLAVVTLVSLLVQIYSWSYMHGDPRIKRFYAFLSLFTASMLGLVLADNLVVLFACWELVGLCSYFLIGFWFEKPEAADAGQKAFLTTKLGDLGLALGLFLIFATVRTFSIPSLAEMAQSGFFPKDMALWASLLLFCGAIGKSAQVPLFIWLPDAMEGPTPVSALIHAATMVAAGVFLVARMFFLFEINPMALQVVGLFGAITAFLAALMGLVPEDIKRVLAYSTVSQLGYMMAGLAVGGPQVGMFHFTTHAMFKALLFLGAGSVIHAMHTNDIWKMGGLSAKMPLTFITFAVAVLALAGIFPLAGFYSKDEIIHAAVASGNWPVAGLLFVTAGLTAYYMTRVLVVVFLNPPHDRERYGHAHESPAIMSIPLVILGVLSVVTGFLLHGDHGFARLVPYKLENHHVHVSTMTVALASSGVAVAGILGAWLIFGKRLIDYDRWQKRLYPLWYFLYHRMGFDEFWLFLAGLGQRLAKALAWLDDNILDKGLVDGWGLTTTLLSRLSGWFDAVVVDNLVDFWGWLTSGFGGLVRRTVSGFVQSYLLYVILGASLILAMRLYF